MRSGKSAVEPSIQYVTTSDGVSIAFCTLGQGMPLVVMPSGPWGLIQLEWQVPALRDWYERLARRRMVVRYDSRGTGLSERDATDSTLESQVLDLGAVIDRLDSENLALLGAEFSAPAAIVYASRYPERVWSVASS